ncbi:MAG: branched-chain amino acid transport system ATP-binding protein [Bacillota bacterium]|nr:branched-chain amino acid transport system ATP-binding protein [Bacillota bacterium]
MTLLEARQVTVRFGGVIAVNRVDIAVNEGEVVSLIGPNGAGKTTLFNAFTGIYRPQEGDLLLFGKSIKGLQPFQIARRGLARTFQNIRLFRDMSALENCLVARQSSRPLRYLEGLLPYAAGRRGQREDLASALAALEFVGLADRRGAKARSLPYGEQRRLEIARALSTGARVLLLDEPAAGMNPQETKELMALIGRIRDTGRTVLLIEHDMRLVMGVSDRVVVLDHGLKIAEGKPQEVRRDPAVIRAYLGRRDDRASTD